MSRTWILLILLTGGLKIQAQNVGIGTPVPDAKLQINATGSATRPLLKLYDSTSGGYTTIRLSNNGSTGFWQIGGSMAATTAASFFDIYNSLAGSYLLTVRGDGNMGVGFAGPSEKLTIGNGNLRLMNSDKGVMLDADDRPFITRAFDPFTSGNYNGLGRWGLFMEPSRITIGMPDVAGKAFNVSTYNLSSTVQRNLLSVNQNGTVNVDGELTRTATGAAHLLPVAYGSIRGTDGVVRSGSGNITCVRYTAGGYRIAVTGETYSPDTHIVQATMYGPSAGFIHVSTIFTAPGEIIVFTRNDASVPLDRDFSFVVYRP